MGKTYDIRDYSKDGWDVSEVICVKCCKRWLSVRLTETLLKNIECPKCKKQGYAIETGQPLED